MTTHATLLSQRVQAIKPSPTLAVTGLAMKMRAEGKDIIGLGSGEPDFDTPDHIKEAAIRAIHDGKTKYTRVEGIQSLREAICDKLARENALHYNPDDIIVSTGGKQTIYNLLQAVCNDGDEVIVPAPYWVSYPDMALLAGAKPVVVSCPLAQGFKMTPAQLANAITPRTKVVFLNSPSNPTGAVYSLDELRALAEVLLQHPHVLIATDDMYEHIKLVDYDFVNIVNACPELKDRTFVLNGVSKAFAMTGWRIGYVAAARVYTAAMKKIQSQSTSNACSIAQHAAEAALRGGLDCVAPMVKAFRERHDYVVSALNAIDGINCPRAQGAFYSFADISGYMQRLGVSDDITFANLCLEKVGVALVPGSAFGMDDCFRLSFATSMDVLRDAISRIARLAD